MAIGKNCQEQLMYVIQVTDWKKLELADNAENEYVT